MKKNKVKISSRPINGRSARDYLWGTSFVRCIFIYLPILLSVIDKPYVRLGIYLIFAIELVLFSSTYWFFYIRRSPTWFAFMQLSNLCPTAGFIGGTAFLSRTQSNTTYYLLFLSIYIFVEFIAYRNYRRIPFQKVIYRAKKDGLFVLMDTNTPRTFDFTWMRYQGLQSFGLKESSLDKLLSYWIVIPFLIISPIAQLSTFATPFRDLDLTTFVLAFMWMIMGVMVNGVPTSNYLNMKLVKEKEAGMF